MNISLAKRLDCQKYGKAFVSNNKLLHKHLKLCRLIKCSFYKPAPKISTRLASQISVFESNAKPHAPNELAFWF